MAEDVFPGIEFTLPARGKIDAAREIGRQCGLRWYAENSEDLPSQLFPDSISEWSPRCRYAWREGLATGWHAATRSAEASATPAPNQQAKNGALIGYARVSTHDQSTNLQLDALNKAGCSRVFSESASGAQRDRPELARALDYLRWVNDARTRYHQAWLTDDLFGDWAVITVWGANVINRCRRPVGPPDLCSSPLHKFPGRCGSKKPANVDGYRHLGTSFKDGIDPGRHP